jgi:oligoendopeptidase F
MLSRTAFRPALAVTVVMSMSVLAAGQQQIERDRAKVADKYKWNLADIYPNEAAWRKQKETIVAELPRLRAYQGKLVSSAQTLAEALALMSRR